MEGRREDSPRGVEFFRRDEVGVVVGENLCTVGRGFNLYKRLFHFKALLWESIILLLPPPPPAKPILLQYYCTTIAQYTPPPPTAPFYAIHHTLLVMAISCKG